MKTAVDSSVLLDVLGADPEFGEASREALRSAHDAGALVACEVVWAEARTASSPATGASTGESSRGLR
jgi:predicted nucleic acid-binding protein